MFLILTHVVFCVAGPESVDHFTLFGLLSQRSGEAGECASWKLEHGIYLEYGAIELILSAPCILLSVEKEEQKQGLLRKRKGNVNVYFVLHSILDQLSLVISVYSLVVAVNV